MACDPGTWGTGGALLVWEALSQVGGGQGVGEHPGTFCTSSSPWTPTSSGSRKYLLACGLWGPSMAVAALSPAPEACGATGASSCPSRPRNPAWVPLCVSTRTRGLDVCLRANTCGTGTGRVGFHQSRCRRPCSQTCRPAHGLGEESGALRGWWGCCG